jgi:hypothetical protein
MFICLIILKYSINKILILYVYYLLGNIFVCINIVILIRLTVLLLFFYFTQTTFAVGQACIDEQSESSVPDSVIHTKSPTLNLRDFLFELFDNGGEDQLFITHNAAKWVMSSADYNALAGYEVDGFPLNWGQLVSDITVDANDVSYTFTDEKWKVTAKYIATGACKNFRMCDVDRLIPFSLPIVLEHVIPQS